MRQSQSGFSLVEGFLVVALVATLFLMVAPMFVRMVTDHKLTAYTNDLVGHLNLARRAAISSGDAVTLCSSDNGATCTNTPWARGYIVFADGGEAGVLDGNDRALKAVTGRDTKLRVTLNGANYVRFLGNGGLVASLSPVPAKPSAAVNALARVLDTLLPVSTAHADAGLLPMPAHDAVAFLVCNGSAGKTIRLTTVGRVNATDVSCS